MLLFNQKMSSTSHHTAGFLKWKQGSKGVVYKERGGRVNDKNKKKILIV